MITSPILFPIIVGAMSFKVNVTVNEPRSTKLFKTESWSWSKGFWNFQETKPGSQVYFSNDVLFQVKLAYLHIIIITCISSQLLWLAFILKLRAIINWHALNAFPWCILKCTMIMYKLHGGWFFSIEDVVAIHTENVTDFSHYAQWVIVSV